MKILNNMVNERNETLQMLNTLLFAVLGFTVRKLFLCSIVKYYLVWVLKDPSQPCHAMEMNESGLGLGLTLIAW